MKKDQIKELWEGMQPTGDPTENYHFLPVSWFTDSLRNWEEIKPINTKPLLCRHSKLNWSLQNKYKLVSQAKVCRYATVF